MQAFRLSYFFLLIIAVFGTLSSLAQNEGNIWYFGYNAGIDFNSGEPVAITNSAMYTWEGCASISDLDGNLLFYTNGKKVWNANHVQMTNGFGLLGHDSSTQAAVIVKKPGPNLIYMIFTPDAFGYENGMMYTEVDMGLEGGLGAVNENKNVPIITPVTEKIVAIQHENQMDYWILCHSINSSDFLSYLLTEDGLSEEAVVSSTFPLVTTNFDAIGYLRANSEGSKLAFAGPGLWLYDFNKATGSVSNPQELDIDDYEKAYGVEFSYSGSRLYASIESVSDIFQYNLELSSIDFINETKQLITSGEEYGGAIQLGPDKRIYHAIWNAAFLGVIEEPELLGDDCSYEEVGFYMAGKVTGIGLPNFKNSIYNLAAFSYANLCLGEETEFTLNLEEVDSVYWNFGDINSGEANFSTLENPKHIYVEEGFYDVSLISYVDSVVDSLHYWIYIKTPPIVNLGNDTTLCEGQVYPLDATIVNASYRWQDDSTEPIYYAANPGYYYVDVTQNGCIGRSDIFLSPCDPLIKMPNVFTPNSDGKNDFFSPIEYGDIKTSSLTVYNRWGEKVASDIPAKSGWNGLSNGRPCSDGTYFYSIQYQGIDLRWYNLKGYVTLLR